MPRVPLADEYDDDDFPEMDIDGLLDFDEELEREYEPEDLYPDDIDEDPYGDDYEVFDAWDDAWADEEELDTRSHFPGCRYDLSETYDGSD